MNTVSSQCFPVQSLCQENGCLTVFDESTLPFVVRRVFTVQACAGAIRGQHAHRIGTQALVALLGAVHVSLTDAAGTSDTVLIPQDQGLIVPPMVWSEQIYLDPSNLLLVLCDTPFSEADYIRDIDEFRYLT
ncbi:MAG: FdtA/QdtA family cupin domain-containing protein [Actinomycetota bacterium]|nr:FdtA/QdtA family cupin domain-containing protein [Actinomycetota bacterium]